LRFKKCATINHRYQKKGIKPVPTNLTAWHLSVIWLGVGLSYVVFGIAGFGTAVMASPLLAQFMPVPHIVPLLGLLDFFATSINLAHDSRKAEFSELIRSHMSQSAVTALKLDIADKNGMFTASHYLASIDDGREVFVYGEKVLSVATHPVLCNSAQSIARLYDALHALESRDTMTTLDPNGYCTHRYFTPVRSSDDLLKARDAIAHWSRLSYGFMGRTPDDEAGFTPMLLSDPDFYDPFRDNYDGYLSTDRKPINTIVDSLQLALVVSNDGLQPHVNQVPSFISRSRFTRSVRPRRRRRSAVCQPVSYSCAHPVYGARQLHPARSLCDAPVAQVDLRVRAYGQHDRDRRESAGRARCAARNRSRTGRRTVSIRSERRTRGAFSVAYPRVACAGRTRRDAHQAAAGQKSPLPARRARRSAGDPHTQSAAVARNIPASCGLPP
jgi:hypothetical protein